MFAKSNQFKDSDDEQNVQYFIEFLIFFFFKI